MQTTVTKYFNCYNYRAPVYLSDVEEQYKKCSKFYDTKQEAKDNIEKDGCTDDSDYVTCSVTFDIERRR